MGDGEGLPLPPLLCPRFETCQSASADKLLLFINPGSAVGAPNELKRTLRGRVGYGGDL